MARLLSAIALAVVLATAAHADGAPGVVLYMGPILPGQVYYPYVQPNGYGWYGVYGTPYGGAYGTFYGSGAYGMSAYQPFGFVQNNIFVNPIQYSINGMPNGLQANAFIGGGNALAPWNGMAGWNGASGAPYLYYQAPGQTGVQWSYGLTAPPVWGTSAQIIDPMYFTRPQCGGTEGFSVYGTPFVLCAGVPIPAFVNGPIPSMIYFPALQKPAAGGAPNAPVVNGAALPVGAQVNPGPSAGSGSSPKPSSP